jgi:hypothetical protein
MKTFISATDIEDLAAQGVRELTVDDDTVLTAVARETAARLGVKLLAPGAAPVRPAPASAAPAATALTGAKPKGCQHGPLTAGSTSTAAATPRPVSASSGGPVVDELIGAVKQLARK